MYLQTIKELSENNKIVFPKALIKDLSQIGFDAKIITYGCEEHLYCATVDNLEWHYGKGNTYKNMILPKFHHGEWSWTFMVENQGCAEWYVTYNSEDDEDPQIYLLIEGQSAKPCGRWSEFILDRVKAKLKPRLDFDWWIEQRLGEIGQTVD